MSECNKEVTENDDSSLHGFIIIVGIFISTIIIACSIIYYFIDYEGKFSVGYFSSYKNTELTVEAMNYFEETESFFKKNDIEIISAEFTAIDNFDHSVSIDILENGKHKEIEVIYGDLYYADSIWIDFERPENIWVYIKNIDEAEYKKIEYAKATLEALKSTAYLVREHMYDNKNWRSVFHEQRNND